MTAPSELIEAAARASRNVQRDHAGREPYSDDEWREFLHAATIPGSGAAYHMRATGAAASVIIEACAKWIDRRRDDYVGEHGAYDPSTGATEFPGNGDEYVYELEEIAEGIRTLAPVKEG